MPRLQRHWWICVAADGIRDFGRDSSNDSDVVLPSQSTPAASATADSPHQPIYGSITADDVARAVQKTNRQLDLKGAGAVFSLPAQKLGNSPDYTRFKTTGSYVAEVRLRNGSVVRIKFNVDGASTSLR